ncbi:COQ9 family protein [Pseudosulfitobacter pseudonitzschiae]|uniref:COQ9 family protein n=1 Tax=Pseudosulfitobacter pseudonitzschiae TaxID=1402135 RepID=UPI001AF4483E|nr:COQ9 family protein [Pseudosulfitobacter pseudonitzschiae]MBM1816496.1 COQ9 family protein [Pseudosulfitobacter pseudonitzschiae]MBM1833094.1 COQ9 family protein [Pseudosulfitobacter pseudonitzschiae]MBM1837962.1 COQ9 family protein [Pseudosulfitobacter pseudonitzschiae]MBM1843223.1 COQ9 family protein [Pseudosulfitobacter pseudonitzschiae]MBM1848089.1 COQ9 family protein [Pseudosulfitobacter pseudonitzschiae]
MNANYAETKEALLQAALSHVAFDGWTDATFQAAIRDADVAPAVARAVCPRGAVDLALAYHAAGDQAMVARLQSEDLSALRFRDRIAAAVRYRLEAVEDKEAVRRGTTLFALPTHAADGAKAIWGTADAIWTALGDTSDDVNWYTKRATLSGVYGSTVLYWLGDDSVDHQATWAFLDRRIDNVMQIEKLKAQVRDNPVLSRLMAGPSKLMESIRRPSDRGGFPGRWSKPRN